MNIQKATTDQLAQIIWDYMLVRQPLKKCDAILVLCSIDDRVAQYAAELFLNRYGKWIIFSGGVAHQHDMLATNWEGSEAEHFATIAIKAGVPKDKILIESKALNTGENIRFSYELLNKEDMIVSSLLLVQKPYMERRTLATFEKQWPVLITEIVISSPQLAFKSYCNAANPRETVINIMVGDLQRIREYPKLGYQTEQPMPNEVWEAGQELIARGYNKHLLPTS